MKKVIMAFCLTLILSITPFTQASAQQTWIVIGDSIMSKAADGQAENLALHLIAAERNIAFKNIAAPGNSLGASNHTGYNNPSTLGALGIIGGMYSAYNGIIIQAGTNDFGLSIPWENTANSLRNILTHARGMQKKVIVMEPIWRSNQHVPNALGYNLDVYRFFMYLVCREEYPDICHYARKENSLLGTSAGYMLYQNSEVSSGTQLHPNVAGHRVMADWINAEAATAGFF